MCKEIIPIALFAYARPDHLIQTLNGLRGNKVPLIYAFCDGPKDESKFDQVRKVRDIVKGIDWTEVITIEREKNYGLGTSLRSGISEVLKNYEKVIVIEDDIVLRPGAYEYTCTALKHYENNPGVMSVSMWTYPTLIPRNCKFGYFSERFVCWGWGTYRKYWNFYDKEPSELLNEALDKRKDLLKWGKDIKIQAINAKKYNVWYVGYALCHFIHEKYSFFPCETLIINIGRDEQATHTIRGLADDFELLTREVSLPDRWPAVHIEKSTSKRFRSYFDHQNKHLILRLGNKLKRFYAKIIHKIFH